MKRLGRPKKESWPTCKAAGCTEEARAALGFCQTHYMAARRGRLSKETGEELRPMMRVPSYGEGARCLVSGCGRRPKGRGLCEMHYQQWASGTDQIPSADRGYQEKVTTAFPKNARCLVEGCDQRPVNKWMCSKHAQQRQAGVINEFGAQLRPLQAWRNRPKDGPTLDGAGYVLVRAPDGYQGKTRQGRVLLHRLVMEQHLGRLLHGRESDFYEIVHHKDGNPLNNDLSNLELRLTRTHPPGHEASPEQIEQYMEALRQNDPDAFEELIKKFAV